MSNSNAEQNITFADIRSKLKGLKKVKGTGKYMALCPTHHDHNPSLSITEKDGHILAAHCFAGCPTENVYQALGIYSAAGIVGTEQDRIEDIYKYEDESGKVLFEILRKGGKKFVARKPSPTGGWEYNLVGVRRVLFGLPKLVAAQSAAAGEDRFFVFICEGEKDVKNLEQLGLIATCNPNGAGKWHDDYSASLTGLHCVVLPDNDEPGRKHAEQVARSVQNVAASVRVFSLPDLPEKGDVSDWLAQGGTADKLIEISKRQPKYGCAKVNIFSARDLLTTIFPELKWAVVGILPEGLVLFVGSPKLGKSWFALGVAAAVSSGGDALGAIQVEGGDVLYLALEDGRRRLQRRLNRLLRNTSIPTRLELATEWPRMDAGGIEALEDWLKDHPAARLVVIDTLKRVRPKELLGGRLYDGDYDALTPLGDLALHYGVCILLIHHTRKAESSDVIDLASGTHGLTGAADAVLVLKRARGQADATLHATGRDFEDKEIALRWDNEICGFRVLGDAGQYTLSDERLAVIALLENVGPLRPKQVAQALEREYSATKKLLWTMKGDGQLKAVKGRYSIISGNPGNPVTDEVEGPEDLGLFPKS
jgi:AAA domain